VTTHPTPSAPLQDGDVPVASERTKDKKHEGTIGIRIINNVKNSMVDVKKYNKETQQGGGHPKA
jgi:hypothetical protein